MEADDYGIIKAPLLSWAVYRARPEIVLTAGHKIQGAGWI